MILLDTHLLIWASAYSRRLPDTVREELESTEVQPAFSAASIWEVAIKSSLPRDPLRIDPHVFRRGLLDNGFVELAITGAHTAAAADLPAIHRDPFDRLLVAQARIEGIELLTADARLAEYAGPIRRV